MFIRPSFGFGPRLSRTRLMSEHPTHCTPGDWRARVVIVLEPWQLDGLLGEELRLRPNQRRRCY